MGVIYKITSPSGKGYVGQTRRELNKRMERHRDMKWGNCTLLKRAIKKYGWKRMQVQVLWTGSNEELGSVEIAMIRDHGTLAPHGYNSLPGGDVNPMSVQIGRDNVRASWANPAVRERHRQGRLNAWQDPVKRANQMAARERVREAKIAAYPPEEQDAVRERFRKQREAQARSTERKQLTSSGQSRGKREQTSEANGSNVTGSPKFRPSGASPRSPRSAQERYMGRDGEMHDAGSTCPSECDE
jgi:hypothetical protein